MHILKLVKESVDDLYKQQLVIQDYPITNYVKTFFNLSHYSNEFYVIQTDAGDNKVFV